MTSPAILLNRKILVWLIALKPCKSHLPRGESERLKHGDGETQGPMKSAQGKNSETPVSTSLNSFSSVTGVTALSTDAACSFGELSWLQLVASVSAIDDESRGVSTAADAKVRGGGVGVEGSTGTESVGGETSGVSTLPGGTGRLTLVTVGKSLRTLVVVVVGAAETIVSVLTASEGGASASSGLAEVPLALQFTTEVGCDGAVETIHGFGTVPEAYFVINPHYLTEP